MRLIRGLSHFQTLKQGCVLTIGNFDGLHLGHQAVIHKLAAQGKFLNIPVVLMTFEPQPLEYFLADNMPSRLTRLREKVIQLQQLPVDDVLVLSFNRAFANLEAETFIEEILLKKLNIKYLVIGDDFHFGKSRRGNFSMLQQYGKQYDFIIEDTQSYEIKGLRVSSTLIRDALGSGDLALAKQMLGRNYSVCGRVAHGDKIGRTIGFPTANIQMFRKSVPISGVFAVTMTGINGSEIQGVANVGTRPTIAGGSKVVLETHLFNFCQEIYGHYVEVHFHKKLRDEIRFDSLPALKAQIEDDVKKAHLFFRYRR